MKSSKKNTHQLYRSNYVDLHCHPAIKPFGKSFNKRKVGVNNKSRNRRNSIWNYNPPSLFDKLLNVLGGLTKFSQSNFSSLSKGEVSIICASLYPIERQFFDNDMKPELLKDLSSNFATGIGKKRVDHIQGITDYYEDLKMEVDFYHQLNNRIVQLPEGRFTYCLVNSYAEIEAIQNKQESNNVGTIFVILSIEGLHVLNSNFSEPLNHEKLLSNLIDMKGWEYPPLFVSVAHHFWNNLCGHSKSFDGIVDKYVNQEEGLDTGFTDLGKIVVHQLLDQTNGKRIHIDVKHMSVKSRQEYYAILNANEEYKKIPIIVSHGAVNGYNSFEDDTVRGSSIARKLNHKKINIYNSELILIAQSNGIIGLQLDERRLANEETLKRTKNSLKRNKVLHYRSELLWNQIQHILEVLDSKNIFAWNCISIGSDFDGIIDPLNGFWTAEEFPLLESYLERHAFNYMDNNTLSLKENNINADEIVDRIMSLNGKQFLKRFFI